MITGTIRNKIDKIWDDIFASGLTMPFKVIEQITYLMFIRSLDQNEIANEKMEAINMFEGTKIFPESQTGQAMRWSKFKDADAEVIFKTLHSRVFPAMKEMKGGRMPDFDASGEIIPIEGNESETQAAFTKFMKDALFKLPTPEVTEKVITGLEDLYSHDLQSLDLQGDLYEYMLGKAASAGINGQFRTPKQIRDMMVALIAPTPNDTIIDPACGTAGFLISSAEFIKQHYEKNMTSENWEHFTSDAFTGYDTDMTMLRISSMNLMLHGITHPTIEYQNSVAEKNTVEGAYTVCLANPPFKGLLDKDTISTSLKAVTNTKSTELLFVALFLRLLKKGGRCACIVPDGVLFGSSRAHKSLRKELVENHYLQAVISMPSGVFKPYAGVSTAILVFTKTGAGGTENVWFYDMKADGYSLDDKRSPIEENDIPDIIARYKNLDDEKNRARTEKSFFVSKEEIAANDYDLSINKYKKVEYIAEEFPPTEEIIARLAELDEKIGEGMKKLRGIL